MRLRARLQKLERAVLVRKSPQTLDAARQTYAEQREAYLRGQGPRPPDPPCPRGIDPAATQDPRQLLADVALEGRKWRGQQFHMSHTMLFPLR